MVSIKDLGEPESRNRTFDTQEEHDAELAARMAEFESRKPYTLAPEETVVEADHSAFARENSEQRALMQTLRKDATRGWFAKTESWALIIAILALLVSMIAAVLPYYLEHSDKALEHWDAIKSMVIRHVQ